MKGAFMSRHRSRWFAGIVLVLALVMFGAACSSGSSTTTVSSGNGATNTSSGSSAAIAATSTSLPEEATEASPAEAVLSLVYPSVVNIVVQGTVQGQTGQGVGSGIVYTADGLILTNDHVVTLDGNVTSGQTITVNFSDGSSAPATLVGTDATRDVAAIQVNKTGLKPVTFATPTDVQLAEWAIVIGSPLDYRNSVTLGIISGLDRTFDLGNGQTLSGLVQLDAAVSPGNSGGGCFDASGHFVGMPEIYLPPGQTGAENISFAIPASVVLSVAKTLTGK
jgi:S1-C subfamily serine protease